MVNFAPLIKSSMKNLVFFLTVCFLFSNCDNREAITKLQTETENLHDEAMKEMAEMNRIARNMKKDPALLVETTAKNVRKDSILVVLTQIDKAEADMMSWMTTYVEPDEKMEKTAAITYLTEQKVKMEKNQKDIHAAVVAGKNLIKI
jgi:hypothetical protein